MVVLSRLNNVSPQPDSETQRPETIAASSSATPMTVTSLTFPGRR
ncbi:Uncharacterised protein [Mycobacteroides abscessus subsp. abscessus]|nr:Uncharacterised protein [Mycobacteroides abscessus subsp. abscessus]